MFGYSDMRMVVVLASGPKDLMLAAMVASESTGVAVNKVPSSLFVPASRGVLVNLPSARRFDE